MADDIWFYAGDKSTDVIIFKIKVQSLYKKNDFA
jgi:hypothetical protein